MQNLSNLQTNVFRAFGRLQLRNLLLLLFAGELLKKTLRITWLNILNNDAYCAKCACYANNNWQDCGFIWKSPHPFDWQLRFAFNITFASWMSESFMHNEVAGKSAWHYGVLSDRLHTTSTTRGMYHVYWQDYRLVTLRLTYSEVDQHRSRSF